MQYLLPPWLAVLLSLTAGATAFALSLRRRRVREPAGPRSKIADVLGGELKPVAEVSGVRWTVAIYPETLSVPGYVVLTAILQNGYDRVRTATLEIAPGPLLPHGHNCSVALNGGEAGVLRTPVFVSRTTPVGDYALRSRLTVRAPHGEGKRLLPAPRRESSAAPAASLRIVSAHDHPPVNLFAYDWKGFISLYIPPGAAPDLTELRILQELPSFPEED